MAHPTCYPPALSTGSGEEGLPHKELRDSNRSLFLLALAAFAIRGLFLVLEPSVQPMGDEPSWIAMGAGLMKARHPFSPLNRTVIFYPPVYPYFIGLCDALFGTLAAVKWLQAATGSLLVLAVGRVGRLVASPRVGRLAATFAAFYPDLVWYSVHFWSETLFLVLLWWAFERLLTSERFGRHGSLVTAGILWGLATLTRETILPFIPVIGLWLALRSHRPDPRRRAALFALAAFLTVAPWTLRNWIVFHAFVPVSTFGAHSLWQGNTHLPREEMYRLSDSAPGPIAQYRLAWEMGWRAVRERQPAWLLEKIGSEMPAFWGAESHVLVHLEQGAYGPVRSVLIPFVYCLVLLPYLAVLALAILGLAASCASGERALLLLFVAYTNAIHVATFASDRFRLPVMPVLFLLAAEAWTRWREGALTMSPLRQALAWALGVGMTLLVLPGLVSGIP